MRYTLPEIYERVIALPKGGYFTTDVLNNKEYVYSLIHAARGVVLTQRFKDTGQIPAIYYQRWQPTYSALEQISTNYVRFENFPTPLAINGLADGVGYVGVINGCSLMFRECRTRAEFASQQNDRIMRAGRKAYVLTGSGFIEIYYKDKIKEIAIEGVFAVPTDVPTYNVDVDPYPMDLGDISRLEEYLMRSQFGFTAKTPVDRVTNARDDGQPPIKQM